jgi:hypothetical protein
METKTQKVKEYLEAGNYIDDAKAVELCKSYRLSAIIFNLRHNYDMNIQDRWIETETSRYKQYYLLKK